MEYHYIIPTISVPPPSGYRLTQCLPLDFIRLLVNGDNSKICIRNLFFQNGKTIIEDEKIAILENGEWKNPEVHSFAMECPKESDWEKGEIGYLETQLEIVEGAHFIANDDLSFYTIFSGVGRKTFFSDNALAYGDYNYIDQIQAFGKWVAGYPCSVIDVDKDMGESVLLINPYQKKASAKIQFVGYEKDAKVTIPAQSAIRFNCSSHLGSKWEGQIFVSGNNRLVVFFAKHSLQDPSNITTIEHPDAYRGNTTYKSSLHTFLNWLHIRRRINSVKTYFFPPVNTNN